MWLMLHLRSWSIKNKSSQVMTAILALAFSCTELISLAPIIIKENSAHGEID